MLLMIIDKLIFIIVSHVFYLNLHTIRLAVVARSQRG